MLLLTEPTLQKPVSLVWAAYALVSAAISIGSPIGVAVPCVSTYEMLRASTPAERSAAVTTRACPSMLGAVKLAFTPPSLLIAAPRSTACTVSPSASASDRRLSSTTVAPSLNTVPRAWALKVRVWPSGDSIEPSSYI